MTGREAIKRRGLPFENWQPKHQALQEKEGQTARTKAEIHTEAKRKLWLNPKAQVGPKPGDTASWGGENRLGRASKGPHQLSVRAGQFSCLSSPWFTPKTKSTHHIAFLEFPVLAPSVSKLGHTPQFLESPGPGYLKGREGEYILYANWF